MEALEEMLRSVHLTGGIFLDALFTEPWCIRGQISPEDCAPFLATPARVICFHFVVEGRALVGIAGEPPLAVAAGEIVLLPRNDLHTLASAPDLDPVEAGTLIQPAAEGGLARIRHGGGGASTRMVCGFLASEERSSPLLDALPRAVSVDVAKSAAKDWIEASIRFAAEELAAGRSASSSVMTRLAELLLVEAVRNYAATLGEHEAGWLRGIADPQVGRALAQIHHRVEAPWSVESLAREAALSRTAFVDRFTSVVGLPPIRYLTVRRLQTAKHRLRESRTTIAQLAFAVGYESEEAFSRAFKREFGLSPAHWREQQRPD